MSGHRKAALALHALDAEDRNLVLAALPVTDRIVLEDHLAELAELGFDASAVDDVLLQADIPTARDIVGNADAGDIARAIGNEPLSFVTVLLDAGPWHWEQAFLAALPLPVRLQLRTRREGGLQAGAKREAFVVDAVARTLGKGCVPTRTTRGSSFATVRRWIGSWTR